MLTVVWAWLQAHWGTIHAVYHGFAVAIAPILVASVLPALITGLTKSPKPGAARWVIVLRYCIRVISWAEHHDLPGTFRAPVLSDLWTLVRWLSTKPWSGPAALLPFLAASLLLGACASGADGVRQSLTNAEGLITGTCAAFSKADPLIQQQIIKSKASRDDQIAAIEAYWPKQKKAVQACVDAKVGLFLAEKAADDVEAGVKSKGDLVTVVSHVWDLLQAVQEALAEIGVLAPPKPTSFYLPVRHQEVMRWV